MYTDMYETNYSAPPAPLARFKGSHLRVGEGKGREGKKEGRGRGKRQGMNPSTEWHTIGDESTFRGQNIFARKCMQGN